MHTAPSLPPTSQRPPSCLCSAHEQFGTGQRPVELRTPTKHEAELMMAAKSRHRDGIALPKTTRGRTFTGDAFISHPQVVVFKDFEVGQTYTQTLTIINRSYVKNTFR